eukprot:TRINITY_DN3030_c2_g2_i1.p1 TRINITY_DN3030_c2_g2~~TRINITY_DN3030_c2_g2_i1.p1  ORF type:complete len:121 (-),score=46.71 TRINITY_DN3030_c2_g2_i1:204-566(-)
MLNDDIPNNNNASPTSSSSSPTSSGWFPFYNSPLSSSSSFFSSGFGGITGQVPSSSGRPNPIGSRPVVAPPPTYPSQSPSISTIPKTSSYTLFDSSTSLFVNPAFPTPNNLKTSNSQNIR